jgi:hypothetical protein
MKSVIRFAVVMVVAGMVALMVAVPFVLPILPFMQGFEPHPDDATMIAHWREKRTTLERLTVMLKDDPALKRLWKDAIDPSDPGLPPERIALYRALMREAGVVSLSNYGKEMHFLFHASGLSIAGSGKSFVFGEPSRYAEQVEGDLETAAQGQSKGTWQRPLEGRWRLELDKS